MMNNPQKQQGLTLVELVIAMAVLVMLAVIGAPSYEKFRANDRFAVASNGFHNAYRFARHEAIKTSSTMTLKAIATDSWKSGWKVVDATNTELLHHDAIHSDIDISEIGGGFSIKVKGMGTVDGGLKEFTIRDTVNTHNQNCLMILSSGQSELTQGAGCS